MKLFGGKLEIGTPILAAGAILRGEPEEFNAGGARLDVGLPLGDEHGVVDPIELRDGSLDNTAQGNC